MVIEVCVSTHDYDRSKIRAYASAGVKECWFVLGPEKQIELHHRPMGEQFTQRTLRGPSGQVTTFAVPGISVGLDALFAK